MALKGIHHITAITGDAPGNVDFYVRILGLRMVKKTVNFDAPDVYHLYFADETGSPGSVLTFFEFPGAARGRHGAGMIHTIQWGVSSFEALDFWQSRLLGEGVDSARIADRLRFEDPEGLGIELLVDPPGTPSLAAEWPEIPAEFALTGFSGVRVYGRVPSTGEMKAAAAGRQIVDSDSVLTGTLGFARIPEEASAYRLTEGVRTATYSYDEPPPGRGYQGAGSVHHIAWACDPEDQEGWRQRVAEGHLSPTPIIDRQYFYSIYFREPSGVLFEIATIGPGFAIDEPLDHLGESLQLPPQHEHLRERLIERLTPLTNPRQRAAAEPEAGR
jgi:glyoxalase family protein